MRIARRALLGAVLATPVVAQPADWPRQTLRVLIPFAAGGVPDIAARLLAPGMQAALGQSIVVENRPGGGGVVAAGAVGRATDGHTLFVTTGSTQSIAPALFGTLRYDPVRDLAPVSFIARVPHVLLVPASLGVTDLQGLLALLRREPGRHNFGSSGVGAIPHLAGELFRIQSGTEITHVPYRGSAPALTDLVAGRVSLMFDALGPAAGFVQDGRLRAIAAGTRTRATVLPDLPTMAEQGMPAFESYTWAALYITAPPPGGAVARLREAVATAARGPETAARFAELGYELALSGPEELAALQRAEFEKWGNVVRQAGIKPEG